MCAGDELYACNTSLLGSIGVISPNFGFVEVMKRLGVERRILRAGVILNMTPLGTCTKSAMFRLRSRAVAFVGTRLSRAGFALLIRIRIKSVAVLHMPYCIFDRNVSYATVKDISFGQQCLLPGIRINRASNTESPADIASILVSQACLWVPHTAISRHVQDTYVILKIGCSNIDTVCCHFACTGVSRRDTPASGVYPSFIVVCPLYRTCSCV